MSYSAVVPNPYVMRWWITIAVSSFAYEVSFRRPEQLHTQAFCTKLQTPSSFLPIGKKPLRTGVRTGCHYMIINSLYVCVCNIRVFTDCERFTRPISTNPGSMEAAEYGLRCGTCFVARRLEMVEVAGLP